MPTFMDYHDDLKLPPEAIEQHASSWPPRALGKTGTANYAKPVDDRGPRCVHEAACSGVLSYEMLAGRQHPPGI